MGLPGVASAGAGLEKVDGLCWLDMLPGLNCGAVFGLEAGERCCLKIDAFPCGCPLFVNCCPL